VLHSVAPPRRQPCSNGRLPQRPARPAEVIVGLGVTAPDFPPDIPAEVIAKRLAPQTYTNPSTRLD
jgi:hypothetical protein